VIVLMTEPSNGLRVPSDSLLHDQRKSCALLHRERVAHLEDWAKGNCTAIAILLRAVLSRFKGCLPQ
jgi:hypothetical protein